MVCEQLGHDARSINRALLCGTLFPLVFNIVILTVAFRLFSVDELSEAAKLELPVFVLLKKHFNSNFFVYAGRCCSLFAIFTSLLAVSMAMHGALRDVFRGKKYCKIQRRCWLLYRYSLQYQSRNYVLRHWAFAVESLET